MDKIRVLVADGRGHQNASGYGALSRAILLALKRHPRVEPFCEPRGKWSDGVPWIEDLEQVPECASADDVDLVLNVRVPDGFRRIGSKPNLLYTQNALGELRQGWIDRMKDADGIIVPGEFDRVVFARHFDNVFICPQYVDGQLFRSGRRFRKEGSKRLSFIFVGSYSYRKGVDILLKSFAKAFNGDRPVQLHLHCATGLEKENINDLLRRIKRMKKNIKISAIAGQVSPPWMRRIYNRHDAVVSLSRGEGWCMPLHEGLLCGLPVIAPRSTAMDEALPQEGVRRVNVIERDVAATRTRFGRGFMLRYGEPGITCWDAERKDAVAAFRDVADNLKEYKAGAAIGGELIRKQFTLERIGDSLFEIFDGTLSTSARG